MIIAQAILAALKIQVKKQKLSLLFFCKIFQETNCIEIFFSLHSTLV